MKTGARGKANAKKNYRAKMSGGVINSASRPSTNEKVARYVFEEVDVPETPTDPEDEGGEG